MRDVTSGRRLLFWSGVAVVFLLAAVPSWVLLDKARDYLRLVWTFDQTALHQLKMNRIPHRNTEPLPEEGDIRFIEFSLRAPKAREVRLAGSFNQWNPAALALRREGGGRWKALVPLPPGTHYYAFEVDGAWTLDPRAPKAEAAGREASVREVR